MRLCAPGDGVGDGLDEWCMVSGKPVWCKWREAGGVCGCVCKCVPVELEHIPNAAGAVKGLQLFPAPPACDIKLPRCRGWCGRVLFCSDNARIFFTACGEAAPNFGGPPWCEFTMPLALPPMLPIWIFFPSLVELVELVVDSVGDGCRFRMVTVFGAEPPLCSHSSDSWCRLSSSVITFMLFK